MPALLIAAAIVGVFGLSLYTAYETGVSLTDAKWVKEEAIRKKAAETELILLRIERDADRRRSEDLLTEVVSEHIQEKKQLEASIKSYRAQSDGLRISAKACRDDRRAVPTTSKDSQGTGAGDDPEGEIRLPVQVESGLWGIVHDARELAINYETCRALLCANGRCS